MDDLRLLEDLVRDDELPTASSLSTARAGFVDAIGVAPARRWFPFTIPATARLAVAALAVVGVGVFAASGPEPAGPPVGAGPSTASSPGGPTGSTDPTDTFRLVADSAESTEVTARRLSAEFGKAVGKAAPDARWIAVPGIYPDAGRPPKIKGWEATDVAKGGQLFNGGGAVDVGGRWGSLALLVDTDRSVLTCPARSRCANETGPNNQKVVTLTITAPAMPTTGRPFTQLQARVGLPDGRVLVIVHSNDIGPKSRAKSEWKLPLSLSQVTTVATAIASRIKR